jgi:hypothetical protein
MEAVKQQLIVVFSAPDVNAVLGIVAGLAKNGPKYTSTKGRLPLVISVSAVAEDLFDALLVTKADYVMTSIGMDVENVFSMGEVAESLFYGQFGDKDVKEATPFPEDKGVKKITPQLNYETELNQAIAHENYAEAAIIRDIMEGKKKLKDLTDHRGKKKKRI